MCLGGVTRVDVLRAVLVRTELVDAFDQHHRSPLMWAATAGELTITRSIACFPALLPIVAHRAKRDINTVTCLSISL